MGAGDTRRLRAAVGAVVCSLLVAAAGGLPARAQSDSDYGAEKAVAIDVSGGGGAGLIDRPGRSCADGGNGAHFHYEYGAELPAGTFTSLPGDVRVHLDLHAEAAGAPQPTYARAFMPSGASSVAISNERGTIRLALEATGAATCDAAGIGFDGTRLTAPVTGTWTVVEATGSYRQARAGADAAKNTFELSAEVAPGADNPFRLKLDGALKVLKPSLQVTAKKTYWGFLGIDYGLRRVTVVYEVKNVGRGDAYGVMLADVASPTAGVTVLGPKVQKLGDLAGNEDPLAGEAEDARVKFQFGLTKPCSAVILKCRFDGTLTVTMPDALDQPVQFTQTVQATAPALPPPVL